MSSAAEEEEERPLLGSELGSESGDHVADPDQHGDAHRRRVIAMSFAMVVLVDLAAFFLDAPQTSILESTICSRYYESIPDEHQHDCTAGPVQAELATVNQMLNTFNRLPGFIVAIPFGIMADSYGRRPVLILNIVGALLQDVISKVILLRPDLFPPRLIWLSSAATLVGGGDAVGSSMVFLVVADVALPGQRASIFFLLTACGLIGEVVATPLSALLMSKSPWIPYIIYSILTILAGLIPLLFLPETLRRSPSKETESRASCDGDADDQQPAAADGTPSTPTESPTTLSRFQPLVKRNIIALLLAFFVSALGRQSTSFLLQYIRQRFNWKYEKVRLPRTITFSPSVTASLTARLSPQASLLITLRAAVNVVLLLVGLPALSGVLVRRKMSIPGKDLLITRLSVAFFAVGSLVISVAPVVPLVALGIVIFALGSGFAPAARSLVTTFCHQDEAGLLYSALAIAQSAGGLVAGPLLALSFRWGLNLGHEWTGIPFALVAGLFACGFLALSFVRL